MLFPPALSHRPAAAAEREGFPCSFQHPPSLLFLLKKQWFILQKFLGFPDITFAIRVRHRYPQQFLLPLPFFMSVSSAFVKCQWPEWPKLNLGLKYVNQRAVYFTIGPNLKSKSFKDNLSLFYHTYVVTRAILIIEHKLKALLVTTMHIFLLLHVLIKVKSKQLTCLVLKFSSPKH